MASKQPRGCFVTYWLPDMGRSPFAVAVLGAQASCLHAVVVAVVVAVRGCEASTRRGRMLFIRPGRWAHREARRNAGEASSRVWESERPGRINGIRPLRNGYVAIRRYLCRRRSRTIRPPHRDVGKAWGRGASKPLSLCTLDFRAAFGAGSGPGEWGRSPRIVVVRRREPLWALTAQAGTGPTSPRGTAVARWSSAIGGPQPPRFEPAKTQLHKNTFVTSRASRAPLP